MSKSYRYDKALNTVETQAKSEKRTFRLNRNNQITAVYNQNGEQERYAYDECGYLTQQAQGVTLGRGSLEDERHVQHQDIYQQGHKLNRLNNHYYTYDKAGRLTEKTEIRDGFRQKTTYYRWNGSNQLTGMTNDNGEVWYYQYDALGRRVSKECPQQRLKITYLWDGDQLAFTRTFKNNEIISERHSVFNGWQLMAQQDSYQTLVQHYEGNQTQWQHQTSYAICQPNGQVLALLNPKGRTLWRKEKQTLWGICFPNEYKQPNPLDPQMLFAGQHFDEESGLAYNRFRYYDPNSGNYISSDPIGLSGGERPFGYVSNPLDWVDLFGLAECFAKRLGDFGEKKAKEMLEQSGKYQKVFPVQNGSGHGIDLVGLRPDGKFDIFEVKTNISGLSGKLSKRQAKGGKWFANDILSTSKAGTGQFGISKDLATQISKNIGDTKKLDVFVKTGDKNRWYVDEILTNKW